MCGGTRGPSNEECPPVCPRYARKGTVDLHLDTMPNDNEFEAGEVRISHNDT